MTAVQDVVGEEVVARALALRDRLRAEQDATEARTFHSEELHAAFLDAGFYRILVPQRHGGLELPIRTFYETIMELSRGCPSTGWCVCLASGHALQVGAHFGEDAQTAIFGPDGDFRAASRFIPMGTAIPSAGGWTVEGRWDFCSGSPYSTHFLPSVILPSLSAPDGPPALGLAVLPPGAWQRQDDWGHMLGLKGSGSHSVVVEPTEIPHDWVVPVNFADIHVPEDVPGGTLHGNPLYAGRGLAYFCGELAAIAVGIGFAALDEYEHALHTKVTTFTRIPRWQDDLYRQHYGTAHGLLRGARAIVLDVADEHRRISARGLAGGEPFSLAEDHELTMMTHRAGDMVFQAVDRIVRTSGASGMVDGQRLQRYWRDITMFRGHMGMHLELHAAAGAAVLLEASAPS